MVSELSNFPCIEKKRKKKKKKKKKMKGIFLIYTQIIAFGDRLNIFSVHVTSSFSHAAASVFVLLNLYMYSQCFL